MEDAFKALLSAVFCDNFAVAFRFSVMEADDPDAEVPDDDVNEELDDDTCDELVDNVCDELDVALDTLALPDTIDVSLLVKEELDELNFGLSVF